MGLTVVSESARATVIFITGRLVGYSVGHLPKMLSAAMTNISTGAIFVISFRLLFVLILSALGLIAISLRAFESEEMRAKRAERKRRRELRLLADRIATYGRTVHQRYPTGDVVVSEGDLAGQLRRRQDAVVTALNLLLDEQKVQRAPLNGYWKLNV